MSKQHLQISRVVSHALRHEPWVYELELDDEGWTDVESLLAALRAESAAWGGLVADDLAAMMAAAEKQRFEMRAGRIRALYGHSLPGKLRRIGATPPDVLYHGTAPETVPLIREHGLRPMSRQYVHLSVDIATAMEVGRRKSPRPVILHIAAGRAARDGIAFYAGNDKVWLADAVPAKYVE